METSSINPDTSPTLASAFDPDEPPLLAAYTRHPTDDMKEEAGTRDRVMVPKKVFVLMSGIFLTTGITAILLIALLASGKSTSAASATPTASASTSAETNGKDSITETTQGKKYKSGELIFSDEFDEFDFDKWQHEISLSGGGNHEFQGYFNTRNNSYVKDGRLYIKPTLTSDVYGGEGFLTSGELDVDGGTPADRCTNPTNYGCKRKGTTINIINPIMSARIQTAKSFAFKYGKVDVSVKLPEGDWIWPAVWLLPLHNEYGSWPKSGEIDIIEGRGNLNLTNAQGENVGVGSVGTTLHYGPAWNINGYDKAHTTVKSTQGFHKRFHKFTLEWTPDEMIYSLDDKEYYRIRNSAGGWWERGQFDQNPLKPENIWKYSKNQQMAPFDKKFFLIINVAIGGTNGYFNDNDNNPKPKPWKTNSPQAALDFWNAKSDWLPTWKLNDSEASALQVDYVRVYAL